MNNKDEIKKLIADILLKNGLIDEELYDKCSKPHITDLPYDNRISDEEKLDERKEAIGKRIKEERDKIKDLESDLKDFEDLNKKQKDTLNDLNEKIKKNNNILEENKKYIKDGLDKMGKTIDELYDATFKDGSKTLTDKQLKEKWETAGISSNLKSFTSSLDKLKKSYDTTNQNTKKYFDDNSPIDSTILNNTDSLKKNGRDFYKKYTKTYDDYVKVLQSNGINSFPTNSPLYTKESNVYNNVVDGSDTIATSTSHYSNSRKENYQLTKDRDSVQRRVNDTSSRIDNIKKEISKSESIITDLEDALGSVNDKLE